MTNIKNEGENITTDLWNIKRKTRDHYKQFFAYKFCNLDENWPILQKQNPKTYQKWRDYFSNLISTEIDFVTKNLMKKGISRPDDFTDNLYQTNNIISKRSLPENKRGKIFQLILWG